MKKLLFLVLFAFSSVSCVSYYNVTVNNDTILYSTENDESPVIYTVSSGTSVYIKGENSKKYRKIKYGKYVGWAYYPNYTSPSQYSSRSTSTSQSISSPSSRSSSASTRSSSSNYTSSGKTVNVKGYYRKNGTYVRPHTRSAPRRR